GQSSYVTQVLTHDDRVGARTGAFVQKARGSTPMTGALWFAAADLLARSEPRKVVLVLTDGEPNDTDSTLSMISRAQSAQLEMIGIGIQHRVDHLFPQAVRIDQLSELKHSLFDVTGQLLSH
ncbi:VWA domain-containing protein, partial [Halorhodospira halochloris]|uniref:VWA domain-containing protein n=1 Tax=Halorhodospira halochloris TaxID=1052 RepID=UPI001EE8EECB